MLVRGNKTGPRALIAAAALCTAASPAIGAEDYYDGSWHFTLTPYLWLPNVNGSMDLPVDGLSDRLGNALGSVRASAEIGPNDYLSSLKGAIMLTGEARKGEWSILTDIIYLDFGNEKTRLRNLTGPGGRDLSTLGVQTETALSGTVWTLAGAYSVFHDDRGHFDLLAGLRYVGIDSSLELTANGSRDIIDGVRKAGNDQEKWDAIAGFKGAYRFGEGLRWYVPYYADLGTGDSNLTWQALVGIGYSFDWGDLNLSMRNLSYEFDENDAHLRFTGPALGVSFHW